MIKSDKKNNRFSKYITIVFLFMFLFPIQTYAVEVPQNIKDLISGLDSKTKTAIEKMYNSAPTKEEIEREMVKQSMKITTSPITPKPYDNVTATLLNFSTDLDRADISWYLNGTLKESGAGKTSFGFSIGGLGSSTKISVAVKTYKGYKIYKTTTITPEELDLLWETDTYTPPFYKGKAMLTPNSVVKIIAMPNFVYNGQKISPKNLIYTWRKDNEVIQKKSGYGKNIFYDESPVLYDKRSISVEVSSFNNSITAYKKIYLISGIPEAIFYKNDPIEGVLYGKAIQNKINLTEQELPIKVEPYFFSNRDKNVGNLVYKWYVNDKEINNSGQDATLRQDNNKINGFSNIKVQINNIYRKYQEAENSFTLNF